MWPRSPLACRSRLWTWTAWGGLTRWWSRRTKDEGADGMNPQLLELPVDQIAAAAAQLRQRFGLTVIDSPPTVHETIRAVANSADLALIPARPTVDDLATLQ